MTFTRRYTSTSATKRPMRCPKSGAQTTALNGVYDSELFPVMALALWAFLGIGEVSET